MVFHPPAWVPKLPIEVPTDVPLCDFILDDKYARHPLKKSRAPFICGLTGKSYDVYQVKERVESLAAALSKEFNWQPNDGSDWDKVLGIFSANAVS